VVYYLVKWCSLPYEDSTWELSEDVDQSKIEEFKKLQAAKPHTNRVVRPSRFCSLLCHYYIVLYSNIYLYLKCAQLDICLIITLFSYNSLEILKKKL